MRDVGGTGFTSLNDYLGANQGVLDAGFAQDQAAGQQAGNSLQSMLGDVQGDAYRAAAAKGGVVDPTALPSYNAAQTAAGKVKDLGSKYGSEAGMAGATGPGGNPVAPEQAFNAALLYGAHGADYKSLGEWLQGMSGAPQQAATAGMTQALMPPSSGSPAARHNKPSQAPPGAPASRQWEVPPGGGQNPPSPNGDPHPEDPYGLPFSPRG